MKRKISIICAILVISLFSTIVIAESLNGDYKGNPIVNVIINGIKLTGLDVPAFIYNGRTMLPLRACVENMSGIVEWDNTTKTASIIKPETSIFFFQMNQDGITLKDAYSIFPVVAADEKVYSMVDISGIPKGVYTIKCKITNLSGTVIAETGDLAVNIDLNNAWASVPAIWDSIKFYKEAYKFNVSMKDSAGTYKTIANKTMMYE